MIYMCLTRLKLRTFNAVHDVRSMTSPYMTQCLFEAPHNIWVNLLVFAYTLGRRRK